MRSRPFCFLASATLIASIAPLPACAVDSSTSTEDPTANGEEAASAPVTATFQNGVSPSASYAGVSDTTLQENAPTTTDGLDASIRADFDYPDATGKSALGLIRFDVSSIPAGAKVTAASLTFNVTNRTTGSGYSLYALSRAWSESQATWNNAASGSVWAAGGARGATDRASAPLGTLAPAATGKATVTLNAAGIAALQKWVSTPGSNFGMALDTSNDPDGLLVDSSNAAVPANRPALAVSYTTAPAAGNGTGLRGTYFSGTNFQTQVLSRVDTTIDFAWGTTAPATGVPADAYSVRWSGQVLPLYGETYTFSTTSDDGIRVTVDGKKIIDDFTNHSARVDSGTIALTAGKKVDILVEYFENTGSAVAELSWSSPSQAQQIVPTSQLFPAAPPMTGFAHPGILLGRPQLDFVKAKVAAHAEPWNAAFNKVKATHFASLSHVAHPFATLTRSTAATADLQDDDIAAYTDALIWYYTGNTAYADKAIEIMNAWSSTLTAVDTATAQLDAAWASEMFPRAAEIIRYTYQPASGHPALDVTAFSRMLVNVLLPQLAPTSNGATYSNGNWELSMADGTMNIGVFTDDHAIFDGGLAMWRARVPAYVYEPSDGAVPVYPPGGHYSSDPLVTCFWATGGTHTTTCTLPPGFAFASGMAQESCRDMTHVVFGLEAMVNAAETARLQGVDLYGEQQKRIVDGYEFASKYDLEALASLSTDGTKGAVGDHVCGGSLNLGGVGYTIGFEIAYNAFASREGVAMPHTQQMLAKVRPTPGALHAAWETLTHAGVP